MATPAPTRTPDLPGGTQMHVWELTTADHTGEAIEVPGGADRTVQFEGTWGGATAQLEGSNDNGVWVPLVNPASGSAISATTDATGMAAVLENPRYIRPRLTTVGVGAAVSCHLFSRTV